MTEVDLLNDILSSNPNEPAPKGALLLLRTEMKAEFRSVKDKLAQHDERFNQHDERFNRLDRSLDLIAQQVAILVGRHA